MYFIFLTIIRKAFGSFFLVSRKSRSALVDIKMRQSPNPSAFSKYNAAFMG